MHTLPKLNYSYKALEPYIDEETMMIHHGKHHQAYVDNLNKAISKYPNLSDMKIEDLLIKISSMDIDKNDKQMIINNGGGHYNHSIFWNYMDPANSKDDSLCSDITKSFGSIESFKNLFTETAMKRFGSGWVWLAKDKKGVLKVFSTANQDSPIMEENSVLLGLDVWEHAYYLKYRNLRADYIKAWWNTVKLI